jgi:sigma-E factor negative regulatory protein RseC
MIVERGKVSQLEGSIAWVECQSSSACERCARGQGCGGGVLGALLGDRLHRVQASAGNHELKVGDQVELGIAEISLVSGAMLVYMLPLAGLFAGALGSGYLVGFDNDTMTVMSGAAGLVAGSLLSRRLHARGQKRFQPEILSNLGPCKASGAAGQSLEGSA